MQNGDFNRQMNQGAAAGVIGVGILVVVAVLLLLALMAVPSLYGLVVLGAMLAPFIAIAIAIIGVIVG